MAAKLFVRLYGGNVLYGQHVSGPSVSMMTWYPFYYRLQLLQALGPVWALMATLKRHEDGSGTPNHQP